MEKQKMFSVAVCALAVCLTLCFAVAAWNSPAGTPPDSNVAAPVNTGDAAQYKSGGLGVKIGGAITYWISQIGDNLVFKTGDDFATAVETVNINTDGRIGNVSAPIDDKDAVNKAYLDAQSGGSGGTGYGTCTGTMLDIKFTAAEYDGNMGGVAGADAKCAAEYPGYTMCDATRLENVSNRGCLPAANQYGLSSGWFRSRHFYAGNTDCADFTSNSLQRGSLLANYATTAYTFDSYFGLWALGGHDVSCDYYSKIACCKEI